MWRPIFAGVNFKQISVNVDHNAHNVNFKTEVCNIIGLKRTELRDIKVEMGFSRLWETRQLFPKISVM